MSRFGVAYGSKDFFFKETYSTDEECLDNVVKNLLPEMALSSADILVVERLDGSRDMLGLWGDQVKDGEVQPGHSLAAAMFGKTN